MTKIRSLAVTAALLAASLSGPSRAGAKEAKPWEIGAPIATYWAGPALTDASATQMAHAGFNLVSCTEDEMKVAQKHGLRVMLLAMQDYPHGLLSPDSLNNPEQLAKLDALIARVKDNPALYCYFIADEPNASLFPGLGKLVAHLREKDPAHLAYINLLPTYATNDQLGVKGDSPAASYTEYLRQYTEFVKPDLLSYDHYHFTVNGDNPQYFLNLGLMRQHALDTDVPFLNIIQACTWDKGMRAPNAYEMSWLTYTSLAYGAGGQSFFVYFYNPFYEEFKDKAGMIRPDGTTTPQYDAAKSLNPQFVAIASQLQPLRSLGAYHIGKAYMGAAMLPENAPFHLEFSGKDDGVLPAEGMLLGYFGRKKKAGEGSAPTHVLVVNLNYEHAVTTQVVGPGRLALFDTATQQWTKSTGRQATITLPPGGGKLVRVVR